MFFSRFSPTLPESLYPLGECMKCRTFVVGAIVLFAASLNPVNAAAQNGGSTVAALNAYKPSPATPVFDVNEAAKKPYAVWTELEFKGGKDEIPKEELPGAGRLATYMESEDFFVPAGMILVIDYVNAV